ncbi:VOC family protein [Nocardioides sp. URHA0032]|uniref:VOC family protein n=1 Tax=Nocardioides sp. URHA0032 TaxID=1380388 RepID=UPI0004910A9D|nr:VOC family protein [Nocardioides sp. URHA0032]
MTWLHAVIDVPRDQLRPAAEFWGGLTGWPAGAPWPGHRELRSLEPPDGSAYLHLQEVDGGPRVHLDLESEAPDATVAQARDLGASLVAARDRWQTLASPGGLPFCVLAAADRRAPQPVGWPGGHTGRVVQVCVDSPPELHETEVAFWRALLPGRWVDSPAPEFAGKWHADGSPLQLLFQRLDEADGPVRAHVDHGADDVPAEVRRVRGLGAADLGAGPGWHVLRDPAGMVFCVTANRPEGVEDRDLG